MSSVDKISRAFLGTEFSSRNGIPRDRDIYPGIPRDGIRRDFYSTGRYWTGLNHHEIERKILDGIEIPRDFTGRDFAEQKKHGTPRDGIEIPRD